MHAQCAALFIIGHGLDHAAENIGVDLAPFEAACGQKIGAGDGGESGHFGGAAEQAAIDIREAIGPIGQLGAIGWREMPRTHFGVHRAEHGF